MPLYRGLVSDVFLVEAPDASGAKRKRGSESIPSSKKIKVDEQLSSLMPRDPKDVQCVFYGIERLRHSMDITHSMRVLLSGEELSSSGYFSHDDIYESWPSFGMIPRAVSKQIGSTSLKSSLCWSS